MHLCITSIVSVMKYRVWDVVSLVIDNAQLPLFNETWQIRGPAFVQH